MSNPLLNVTGLPPFKKIQPSHMVEAIETIINDSRQAINELTESVTDDNISWDNFVKPLEDINEAFDLMHEGKSIRTVIHFEDK